MRAFIILATIALAHGAKLERTYLPPSHARTSGGSGNFLQTPISGSNSQTAAGFSQNGAEFSQTGASFSQSGNGLAQTGASFSQSGNGFSQTDEGFSQSENGISQLALKNQYNGFNNLAFESRPERAQAALERNAAILRQDSSNDGETFAYAFETENGIYAEENGVATNGVEAQGGYSYTGDDGQVYSIRYTADQNGFVPQGDHIPTAPPVPEEILKALEQNARDEAAGIFDNGSYNAGKYSDNSNAFGQQKYQQNYNGNDDDSVVTNAAFLHNYPADTRESNSGSTGSSLNSGVEKAYLPPFAAQSDARGSSSATTRGSGTSGAEKAYIPPFASQGNPTGISAGSTSTFARASGQSSVRGSSVPSFSARGSGSGVEKAYLPPFAQSANGFGRRQQTFDSKNGYRY